VKHGGGYKKSTFTTQEPLFKTLKTKNSNTVTEHEAFAKNQKIKR